MSAGKNKIAVFSASKMMKRFFLILPLLIYFIACKKQQQAEIKYSLYPLNTGNKWIYVDSFFNGAGNFYSLDTFTLKTAQTVTFNNSIFTPLTDQYDDSIFTIKCTDTSVFLLQKQTTILIYTKPAASSPPVIINSYFNDTLNCKFFTQPVTTTNYVSYKILITYDNGLRTGYKQQELYFTPGIGIIKGRDYRKNSAGNLYAYDSYRLTAYSLY
jgi:hypothetical protein